MSPAADETVEELLARVEREHGPAIAAVVARDLKRETPSPLPVWTDPRRRTEGRRGGRLPAQAHSRLPKASW